MDVRRADPDGCGDRGPQRVIVSGRVTYNGKPISSGVILFVPLPSCPVPSAAAEITDGKYRVDARGGVPVGTHKIKIEGYRKPANAPQPSTAALSGLPAPTPVVQAWNSTISPSSCAFSHSG